MPILNYTDEDIAGLFASLQTNVDNDAAEQSARIVADDLLTARLDALIIPEVGDLNPNVLQAITNIQLGVESEVADREAADANLQEQIDNFVTGADQATVDSHTALITALDDRVTDHDALIAANAQSISDEITSRQNQYDDDIVPQFTSIGDLLTSVNNTLTQEIVDRATADLSVASTIDTVNSAVLDLQSKISNEESARITGASSFSDQLSALSGSLATAQQQILYLSGTGVDPLGALSSNLLDLTYRVGTLETEQTTKFSDNDTVVQDISTDVSTLQGTVTTVQGGLTAEIAARIAGDNALQTQITANGTTIAANASAISAETTSRTLADTTINATLTTISGTQSTLVSDVAAEIATREALSIIVDDLNTQVGGYTGAIAGLETDVNFLKISWIPLLDVDNSIAGIQRGDASGPTTDFTMTAERVAFQTGGGTPINPFSIGSDRFIITDAILSGADTVLYAGTIYADTVALASSTYGKTLLSQAVTSSQLPSNYSMSYGGATSNTFLGNDAILRVVPAEVYTDSNMMLFGADYDTGFNPRRLSKTTATQFNVQAGGNTNASITVWYRVKDLPGDGGDWLYAGTFEHGIPSGARDYERASSAFQFTATVDSTQVIEFGMNALNGQGLPVNPAFDSLYSGWFQVSAVNI